MRTLMCGILSLAAGLAAVAAPKPVEGEIVCEGRYPGHLQGAATDGTSIFWSFTTEVVKTDRTGKLLATSGKVPRHQGDLCVKDGVVYVAVNLGAFNQENKGRSEVHAYDAATMKLQKTWKLPQMGHGAGGMTFRGDRFYVIGGLPATHECNYVYEYDRDFNFLRRHDLPTGFTLMGIQTAAFENDRFLFGIYGGKGNPGGVLEYTADFSSCRRHVCSGDVAILRLDGVLYAGSTWPEGREKRVFGGRIFPAPTMCGDENLYVPQKKGGVLRIYFEDLKAGGWKDCGYALQPNGYRPLTSCSAFVPAKNPPAVLPAVGIGGTRSYSAPDVVRGVRRAAQCDEILTLHVVGTPDGVAKDPKLAEVLKAAADEAKALGVKVERF